MAGERVDTMLNGSPCAQVEGAAELHAPRGVRAHTRWRYSHLPAGILNWARQAPGRSMAGDRANVYDLHGC
jgi:hypothetical protein